ncbi:uncharacterized protein sb:cb1058 [Austrofundulus limnaeus]|uniref:Uncharacterized protein LOC106524983 n=1 Tax=Austrofundulus limnaeus TaxID=52670 RepID=A0A2I4C3D2_AUSLI|nr:PREDICTED: uncharacterized protein LOC106524983 [Austrofundulus limnaeus]XP_013874497.1 PREDICTED: uncharacterized protein LOC106524983 [Austrofundulus limnaeus]
MTIGRNSRKSSVRSSIRAPKFLDKAGGFYGRLEEPETTTEVQEFREGEVEDGSKEVASRPSGAEDDVEGLNFTDGVMEDDGETLLCRKPSRRSSRWRRSSRRKQKEVEEEQARDERPSVGTGSPVDGPVLEDKIKLELEELKSMEEVCVEKEPPLVHFKVQEFADNSVLIRDKKRGREEEGEEERKIKKEQEEGMKVLKRKSYRKAFDRALRRGWEAFITNLYSVTLTPVTSSSSSSSSSASSPSLKKKHQHKAVLAEFH